MNHQISFKQYRTIDLTILTVVLAISQILIHYAASAWFPGEPYVVSPVGIIAALVMMRWGVWAAVQLVLGGMLFTALSGGGWQHYVIYMVGNLAGLAGLLMFRIYDKERVRQSAALTVIFAFCVQLLMLLGRAGVASLLGFGAGACLGFITTDILSGLFTVVIVWCIRRVEGLFEDQKHYLLRIQSEQ